MLSQIWSGPSYQVSIVDFGDGVGEICAFKMLEPPMTRANNRVEKILADNDGMLDDYEIVEIIDDRVLTAQNHQRSVARSRKNMRYSLLMMNADRMLTLTYRKNQTDIDIAWTDLKKFIRLCKKSFGKFDYVAVPEYQKRGALHFHIALNQFYNINVLRHFWQKATKDTGNVNITSPRKGGKWERTKIAKYLSKYMGKSLNGVDIGRKRYSVSKGIPKPQITKIYLPLSRNMPYMLSKLAKKYFGQRLKRYFEPCEQFNVPIMWGATY